MRCPGSCFRARGGEEPMNGGPLPSPYSWTWPGQLMPLEFGNRIFKVDDLDFQSAYSLCKTCATIGSRRQPKIKVLHGCDCFLRGAFPVL